MRISESTLRSIIRSQIIENRICINENNDIDPEILEEIIRLSSLAKPFKSIANMFKSSKEDIEKKYENYKEGDDKDLEDDISGQAEKILRHFAPDTVRITQELEVEIFSRRWKTGYDLRDKEIKNNKAFNKENSVLDDDAIKKGYVFREMHLKSGEAELTKDQVSDAAVESALQDFDEDAATDFVQNHLGNFFGNLNPVRCVRIFNFFIKRFGFKKGLIATFFEASVIVFSFLAFMSFFKNFLLKKYIMAILGFKIPFSMTDIYSMISSKLRDKLLGTYGEESRDLALKIEFISNNLDPKSSKETELVKYEKRNGFEIPLSGIVSDKVPVFDSELLRLEDDPENPENILRQVQSKEKFDINKFERQIETKILRSTIRRLIKESIIQRLIKESWHKDIGETWFDVVGYKRDEQYYKIDDIRISSEEAPEDSAEQEMLYDEFERLAYNWLVKKAMIRRYSELS